MSTRAVVGLGTVLTTGAGRVLYVYAPDARLGVTCHDDCAANWPPLFVSSGVTARPGDALVSSSLLGSARDGGRRVVTYDGWPLYTYLADSAPGLATGQAINLNGGYWYVMAPSGQPIVPAGTTPLPGS